MVPGTDAGPRSGLTGGSSFFATPGEPRRISPACAHAVYQPGMTPGEADLPTGGVPSRLLVCTCRACTHLLPLPGPATFATLGGMRSLDEATQHLLREFFREVLEQARHNEASWLEQLRGEIAAWIAYRVAYGQRFEIDHENDPPGDCSGELRRLPEGFDPENYETLGDFLGEPTGERTPTFERGCGWHFETYANKLDELVRNFVADRLLEVGNDTARERSLTPLSWLCELNGEEPPRPEDSAPLEAHDLWELDQAIPQEPLCEYVSLEVGVRWREAAEEWPLQELLSQGALAAFQQRRVEETVAAEQRRAAAERAARSRAVFELFRRDFEDHLGPFPEGHVFTKKDPFWPKLQRLLLERWTAEERSLLSAHLSCSNSIEAFLAGR